MSVSTTRLGLTKPGGGSTGLITPADIVDIDVLNANFDKIDASIGFTIATSGARPSTPFNGQPIFETDTKNEMYWSTAAGRWIPIGVPNAASQALRDVLYPAPVQGDKVFRSDKGWVEQYYAAYNATTNVRGTSLAGVPTAGWFPVVGSLVGAVFTYTNGAWPSGSEQNVPSFTQVWDPDLFFPGTGTQLKPTVAGRYRIVYAVEWGGSGTDRRLIRLRRNGSGSDANGGFTWDGNNPGQGLQVVAEHALFNGTTDYTDFTAYQSSGGNLSVIIRITFTYIGPPVGP